MNIAVLTIFPEIIADFCRQSLLGKALKRGLWRLNVVNIRDYSNDRHKKTDGAPCGDGQGLIMRPDVLGKAIENNCGKNTKMVYLTPRGKKIDQKIIRRLLKSSDDLMLICGRYEGIDERILEEYPIEELSVGDFVAMGGELPALLLIEGLVRCAGGVIGNDRSLEEDSFGGNGKNDFNYLLEYPLYTKPIVWKGRSIPSVLLSGNHGEIKKWKLSQAEEITKTRRKDIWAKYNRRKRANERKN
ncbi:MAG: tRNA (guanosine(37)-N1)-methyltransferase TrmD [Rickettsiales bacterium]|jgi:tRNA (guanine37-N1)-methyltransferase|nr:tRNA (guanosine(37)-N1)-methyltransferase TrmD [Rickettsiales bacterium]